MHRISSFFNCRIGASNDDPPDTKYDTSESLDKKKTNNQFYMLAEAERRGNRKTDIIASPTANTSSQPKNSVINRNASMKNCCKNSATGAGKNLCHSVHTSTFKFTRRLPFLKRDGSEDGNVLNFSFPFYTSVNNKNKKIAFRCEKFDLNSFYSIKFDWSNQNIIWENWNVNCEIFYGAAKTISRLAAINHLFLCVDLY